MTTNRRNVRESLASQGTASVGDVYDRRLSEYWSETDICPQCKTDRYLNPKLRLLVSRCYHKMCEACIDRLFSLGPAPCPECGAMLRKEQFAPQTFENLQVQKEVVVRQRLGRVFNKTEADFATPREYDDYLEEVEELTFNLINNIDVENSEARVRQFETRNKEAIAKNQKKLEQERERVAREEQERIERAHEERRHWEAHDEALRADEEARRRAVIQGLASGNAAEDVLERAQREKDARLRARERQAALDAAPATVAVFPADDDGDHVWNPVREAAHVAESYIELPGGAVQQPLVAHAGGFDLRDVYWREISAALGGWLCVGE